MKVYNVPIVERYLRSYRDIRETLNGGGGVVLPDNYFIRKPKQPTGLERRERPLGMSPNDPRGWPFWEPLHAKEPFDGKAKARTAQELHTGVIDIEIALSMTNNRGEYLIDDDDLDLLIKYHINQTHTLDDLALERNVASRGSMQRRILRAVGRLTSVMESPKHAK